MYSQGHLANYSSAPTMEGYAKKVVSTEYSNANIVINSKDRNTGTISRPFRQPYNNFTLQKNFPISQGQINSVRVCEVRFPYNIQNVNEFTRSFWLVDYTNANALFEIVIAIGWYSGVTLATAVQNAINGALGGGFTVVYDVNGRFTITSGGILYGLFPALPPNTLGTTFLPNVVNNTSVNTKSLLSVMGFDFGKNDYTVGSTAKVSSFAPMTYTEYIDICSDVLTQYQDLQDTGTGETNPNQIICRLYVVNETSTFSTDASGNPIPPGSQPFTIHRQFVNAKVMKWNCQNSVDRIDIKLFDDAGNLVYIPSSVNPADGRGYDDFQITFEAVEM